MVDDTFTPNLKLRKIAADRRVWADGMNENLTLIDAVISAFFSTSNMQGVWENSHSYTAEMTVVDADTAVVYQCTVPHISASIPTTFAEDRAANPTYWLTYSTPATARGAWAGPGTAYSVNDFVLADGNKYAFCLTSHVSGGTFAADLALGYWSVIIDLSTVGSLVLPVLSGAGDASKFVTTNGTGTAYVIIDGTAAMAMLSGILPVVKGGTGVSTATGGGNVVFSNSPVLVSPAMSAPVVSGGMTFGGKGVGLTPAGTSGANLVLDDGATVTNFVHSTGSISSGVTLANGLAATTQAQADNSTKLATDAYVDRVAVQQVVESATSAAATGTTTIPYDDTIPQNTEGDQYMTVTITPKSATSILVIDVRAQLTVDTTAQGMIYALFQDAIANALKAGMTTTNVSWMNGVSLSHRMVSGTTSAITFKFRAGPQGGVGGTMTFNGSGGTRLMGGVMNSYMRVTEYGI